MIQTKKIETKEQGTRRLDTLGKRFDFLKTLPDRRDVNVRVVEIAGKIRSEVKAYYKTELQNDAVVLGGSLKTFINARKPVSEPIH
ncbi:MAG: hypothetical protein NTV88_00660 [Candidatus Micrarchaeota archaeon]|nr:hypothetical protein [Candidatus Micrarchaeota archaeon]